MLGDEVGKEDSRKGRKSGKECGISVSINGDGEDILVEKTKTINGRGWG